MKNFVQTGNILRLTAPSGGVESGTAYLIGGLLVVALHDADATEAFSAVSEGVVELAKEATTAAFTEGEIVYWDGTAGQADESATGRYPVGTCVSGAIAADTTVKLKLFGYATAAVA